jgi:hypothetical protein
VLAQAIEAAHARFERMLGEHDAPGKRLESARALFDLWIDAAEEAWAEIALSDEYRHVYAQMTNALMRLRLGLQREVEQFGALLGMPGRGELDALHRKVADLERTLHAARRGKPVQAARTPRAGAAAAVAPVPEPVVEEIVAAAAPRKSTRKPVRSAARNRAGAKRAPTLKPTPATAKKADKAVPRPTAVRSVATAAAVKAAKAKPAPAGTKKPAVAGTPPRAAATKREKKAASRVAAAKPASERAHPAASAAATRKPAAATVPVERKPGVRNGTRAAKTASPRVPATAKVVSMRDWVSRNLADGKEPAGKGKSGSRRGGRDR